MNRFVITEEEKKHIMGLYEQTTSGVQPITITSFVLIPEIPDPSRVTTSDGKTYKGESIRTCNKPGGRLQGKTNSDIPEGMTIYLNYANDKDLVCTNKGCILQNSNLEIRTTPCKK